MTDIPQPGSVWVYGFNEEVEATVLWADALTVVYNIRRRSNNYRNTTDTSSFLGDYKPKPNRRTVNINGTELPEPMRDALKDGDMYWFTCITEQGGVYETSWDGDPSDRLHLKRGNVFRTEAEATAWFRFELKLRRGEL